MNRREFCRAGLLPLLFQPQAGDAEALAKLKGVSIARISGFRHVVPRPHPAGKAASGDVQGDSLSEEILRIETDAGSEGFGLGSMSKEMAATLIGKSLDDFWKPGIGVVSPLGRSDHALYDLIGKVLDLPIATILGGSGPDWIAVVDGSVFFNDLLPERDGRSGVRRLLHEVEQGLKSGYRAFKIQVGRGLRWMDADDGFRRDVEVVRSVRKLVGPSIRLMADGGDGFDPETAERWLDAVGEELLFVEAMFPEQVEPDLRLREFLRRKGSRTLVADGETADDLDDFAPLIARGALDVYRPDIVRWGLTRCSSLARKLALRPGPRLAPNNAESFLGLYMQLAIAAAVPNFLVAEAQPGTSDLVDASAYVFANGKRRVPDVPGHGLTLRGDVLRSMYAKDAWVVS